ncbi:mycofactocin biosynthesis chaperone MftB [Pseudonocardia sp. KRD291]|uniref:mycofactocin biosynthesis chaperone MftB n=1 Tax=Pseudonocardia sp. KRD291 TaxID=2792007 RepID=UPI001C4A65D8|nr:mycofactocin biosynthesis chaperone MftB [Pseudonocardia sp. KRD291]MBW0104854.1 mycofactocin biosynthesis chaperone MftB [Pseudonocardia sp. KRD291]
MSTKPLDASATVAGPGSAFDPGSAYRCSPNVALRPEPFGALVYDFVTRKLSFLKTPELVEVVKGLENHPDVHAAISAAGVAEAQRPAYVKALAGLAESGTIEAR